MWPYIAQVVFYRGSGWSFMGAQVVFYRGSGWSFMGAQGGFL